MSHPHHAENLLIPITKVEPCAYCGKEAHYVEISFETPICSPECAKQIWKEYVDTQLSRKFKPVHPDK
ncbi:hypothetical protein [Hazenella coriacea]|uniref:Uncharacterized protein n=1 Tax=Hazenella coriacea TaxID=1179467 RepID=A0A4R3LAQ5_9BACL|nr:hypothetical protein [Hazenella coriacea]TCS94596.1 hypothetical protein EDD58_1037 [Hazenella coriacea]